MTHPFHPLFGQEFEYDTHNKCWGEDRVYFFDPEGKIVSMPARWTSASLPDPFVVQSAGRCILHFEDLLSLARLLDELRSQYLREGAKRM